MEVRPHSSDGTGTTNTTAVLIIESTNNLLLLMGILILVLALLFPRMEMAHAAPFDSTFTLQTAANLIHLTQIAIDNSYHSAIDYDCSF